MWLHDFKCCLSIIYIFIYIDICASYFTDLPLYTVVYQKQTDAQIDDGETDGWTSSLDHPKPTLCMQQMDGPTDRWADTAEHDEVKSISIDESILLLRYTYCVLLCWCYHWLENSHWATNRYWKTDDTVHQHRNGKVIRVIAALVITGDTDGKL